MPCHVPHDVQHSNRVQANCFCLKSGWGVINDKNRIFCLDLICVFHLWMTFAIAYSVLHLLRTRLLEHPLRSAPCKHSSERGKVPLSSRVSSQLFHHSNSPHSTEWRQPAEEQTRHHAKGYACRWCDGQDGVLMQCAIYALFHFNFCIFKYFFVLCLHFVIPHFQETAHSAGQISSLTPLRTRSRKFLFPTSRSKTHHLKCQQQVSCTKKQSCLVVLMQYILGSWVG